MCVTPKRICGRVGAEEGKRGWGGKAEFQGRLLPRVKKRGKQSIWQWWVPKKVWPVSSLGKGEGGKRKNWGTKFRAQPYRRKDLCKAGEGASLQEGLTSPALIRNERSKDNCGRHAAET